MGTHLIVGAGTVGVALARRLSSEGEHVTLVSRRGTDPALDGVVAIAADASDRATMTELARGAATIFNCANPQYHRWERDWPPIAAALLAAASEAGAVLVTLSNLYGYGPVDHALAEDLELAATSRKGRVRAAMWHDALRAHEVGAVRATEVRASDYFGPTVRDTGVLGSRVVPRVLDGRAISLLGDLDAPHSWTFVDDVVTALEVVARDERAWGRPWHVPTAPPFTEREAVEMFAEVAGLPVPTVHRLPWALIRAAGVVSPQVRGILEVAYQFDHPFVVDSSAFTATFGVKPTPSTDAIASTLSWWRAQRGFPLRSLASVR